VFTGGQGRTFDEVLRYGVLLPARPDLVGQMVVDAVEAHEDGLQGGREIGRVREREGTRGRGSAIGAHEGGLRGSGGEVREPRTSYYYYLPHCK